MGKGNNRETQWDKEKKIIGIRCSLSRVHSIVKKLNEEKKELVRQMRFKTLLGLKKFKLRTSGMFQLSSHTVGHNLGLADRRKILERLLTRTRESEESMIDLQLLNFNKC